MDFKNLGKYLKSINDNYSKDKSISEILNNFKQISDSYNIDEQLDKKSYNNIRYDLCSIAERKDFYNDQLQFIECLVTNNIYDKKGIVWNFIQIYDLMNDENYKNVDKINRHVTYSTSSNIRPIGELSYNTWNGMQIIDLDIKDYDLSEKLKDILFDELSKYHWFLGVSKSSSHKGLHIWTKITPISITQDNKKIEYLCNFRHKYSYVYIVLLKYSNELGYSKDDIIDFMDMAMAKPQQGIFIASDKLYISTNFVDVRLDVNFETAFNTGIESINWISHPDLKNIFAKLEWFNNDLFKNEINIEKSDIESVGNRDLTKSLGAKHYKHNQRWQLANTLTSVFGESKALDIMIEICQNTPVRELKGDIKTAAIHNKPISIWAINELNNVHGFNITLSQSESLNDLDKKLKEADVTIDPTRILNENTNKVKLHLKHNQYLSDIKDDILNNLSKITLLEAGAGYGKTEMIKSLKAKTLLILPFTSTIKAKIEASDVTKDWLYFYGNKKPKFEDLMGPHNLSMTIDKFSRLNVMELDQSNFEYIVIDESHLLFTSSYRDVMSPTIQRLANCKAKVIMMTGTPTGEMLFFPNIKHIKVEKEDFRNKIFELNMCPTENEQLFEMCKSMAFDIMNDKKILYPTNKGTLYYEQITGLIQQILNNYNFNRELKSFYYKKSNYGDESMDNINIDKSIGSNDIIFCTTYLSVGVDICDKYKFSVYFNEMWIPQDIEQFANRLRNNDLFIKMFLPKKDNMGFIINYNYVQPLDLSIDKKDLMLARDLIKTCNDMLDRNNEESKYSPFISSMLSSNRYLKYDENDCKYYIDETTYKLRIFEERYSDYSKQLPILLNGIKYYGYKIDIINHEKEITEDKVDQVKEFLSQCRNTRYNYITTETFELLDHMNDDNISIYKELIKGSYDLFKNDEFQIYRNENNIYVKDIEIMEKNIPIILGLYRFYNCDVIKEIYKYCVESKSNKINYSKLERIKKFVTIEINRRKKRLDFPVLKFIYESKKFAQENPVTTKDNINIFLANFAAKYANSIKDVIVDDQEYFEQIFKLISELWKVIIIQSKPKNNEISITPFELLWDDKINIDNIYGDSITKIFFEELLTNIKDIDNEAIDIDNKELPKESKVKLENVKNELSNVIHNNFDYNIYSKEDGSNDRFLRKQLNNITPNQNSNNSEDDENIAYDNKKDIQLTLFSETDNTPF